MGWVEDALGQRSVMDPNQRSPIQEWLRGLAHSTLNTGAGLADMASMAIPGRPIGASLLSERLDRYMGDPNAPGAPAAYSGGGLLGQRPRRSLMDPPDPDARTWSGSGSCSSI